NLAKEEMHNLGEITCENLEYAMSAFLTMDSKNIKRVFETENNIDIITNEIIEYLAKITRRELTPDQAEDYNLLLHAVSDIERVGDHSENIAELLINGLENGIKMSDTAKNELAEMAELTVSTFRMAIEAFEEKDLNKAQMVLTMEDKIDYMEKNLRKTHIDRLSEGRCQPFAGIVFLDVNNTLERIGDHATNIAKVVRDINS
ncbi:MAG: PhoU domain-containing protein, partial [Bacillota bacterium]|nr:PhoU domain-containing protein [Bacillota bacterium]